MDLERTEKRAEAWRKAADHMAQYNEARIAWESIADTPEKLQVVREKASLDWLVLTGSAHAAGQKELMLAMNRVIFRDFGELAAEALEMLRAEALEAQKAAERS